MGEFSVDEREKRSGKSDEFHTVPSVRKFSVRGIRKPKPLASPGMPERLARFAAAPRICSPRYPMHTCATLAYSIWPSREAKRGSTPASSSAASLVGVATTIAETSSACVTPPASYPRENCLRRSDPAHEPRRRRANYVQPDVRTDVRTTVRSSVIWAPHTAAAPNLSASASGSAAMPRLKLQSEGRAPPPLATPPRCARATRATFAATSGGHFCCVGHPHPRRCRCVCGAT